MESFWNWCYGFVKGNDVFGKSITLTYKGEDDMKSFYGGVISIILKLAVFVTFMILLVQLFRRRFAETATKTVVEDIFNDDTRHYIGHSGFALGMSYMDYANNPSVIHNYLADQTYFGVRFLEFNLVRNANKTSTSTTTSFEMGNWTEKEFEGIHEDVFQDKVMNGFLCPLNKNYTLQGDYNSRDFYGVRIEIQKCINTTDNGNHWKSDEEINQIINSGYVEISLVNSYFDFDDYDTPIKKYLTSTNNLFMTNGDITRWFSAFIKQNEALTSDGLLYSEPYKSHKFYSISDTEYREIPGEATGNALVYINLLMARESDQYERTAYSFITMFGFLGGLYDSTLFVGFIFVSLAQAKIFDFELISKLYQLSETPDDSSYKDSCPTEGNVNYFVSSEPSQEEQEIEEEKQPAQSAKKSNVSHNQRFNVAKIPSLNNEDSIPEPEDEKTSAKVINDLSNELNNRRSIIYKWYDVYPYFKCLFSSKRCRKSSYTSTQQIYK